MNREELMKALRCCTSGPSVQRCNDECVFYKGADMSLCIPEMGRVVADMLENDQKHIDAAMADICAMLTDNAKCCFPVKLCKYCWNNGNCGTFCHPKWRGTECEE